MRYKSKQNDEVLCDHRGDDNCTVILSTVEFPVPAWKIAQLMNNAYNYGRADAKAEIRDVLGVKQ